MKNLLLALLTISLFACEKTDDLGVRFIFLTIDKDIALASGDQVTIDAEVNDSDFKTIEGVTLEYYANDELLTDNIFRPSERGTYTLTARYKDIVSDEKTVRVVTLEEDVEELILNYEGSRYLTTNDWSVSGTFSYAARIESSIFPIPAGDIALKLDNEKTTQQAHFHFTEAGEHSFQAEFGRFVSNEVKIQIRQEKIYPEVVIPVVFHAYGIDFPQDQVLKLIDTLSRSFSAKPYSRQAVIEGRVNPNAVNCYIRFEPVINAPLGRKLASAGLNVVETSNGEYPTLDLEDFRELEAENGWDPEEYLNVWMAEAWDFDFPSINRNVSFGSGGGRGLVYSPYMRDTTLIGLPTLGANPRNPDPNEISQAILLRSGSIFGSHPDYIVNRVGYYLGLFDTPSFECLMDGDHCPDTFAWDVNAGFGPANEPAACEGFFYRPNNHMSFNRAYTNFTYDQRERMRFVLEHAMFRPGQ